MAELYQHRPIHGYWNKYFLPRPPARKKNKVDTEEQLRFEKLQRELFRIINEVTDDNLDGFHFRISLACKRRNEKLYIRLLYDCRRWWSVTTYMVDLHKNIYKSEYSTQELKPHNDGVSIENSEFYNNDVSSMSSYNTPNIN